MNQNLALVTGRLTRAPESKALPSGSTVATFSVATGRTFTTKDGQKKEETDFHNVVVFGKVAENCARYLIKGQLVGVTGRLQTRNWEKDGAKHYRTEIVADKVDFGPKPSGALPTQEEPMTVSANPYPYPEDEINPEDIPF